MRDETIKLKPFEFINYTEITGRQHIGEHGTFKITGQIRPQDEQEYLALMMQETWVLADALTYDGTVRHLFRGIVLDADIEKEGESCTLSMTLITGSYLMDLKPHIRSFQQESTTYGQILDTIMNGYRNYSCLFREGEGKQIPGLVMQYRETDWEFARRLASHFHTDILPAGVHDGVGIYFGEPDGVVCAEINTKEYSSVRRADGTVLYRMKSREVFGLGDSIRFNGRVMWIIQVDTALVGNELLHTYGLVEKNGVFVEEKHNTVCTGASLYGSVLAVEKDKVKISLEKDENKDKTGTRWFSYATPYSSPDGTGWYCMPETGDRIQLRLPSEDEKEAYVINAVHMESADTAERNNPDYKSIMNKQGKEILLTPESLVMTNNAGMSIEILDNEGIKITSDKDITISAADSIEITSASSKLELYAKDNLLLKQGNTQMCMDGEMRMTGARLNLN